MNEVISSILIEIILPIVGTVVGGLAAWAAKKLINFLDEKTKFMDSERDIMRKDYAKKRLVDVVETSVLEMYQTFVSGLKKGNEDGKLTAEEAKKAFDGASSQAYDMLSTETISLVEGLYEKNVKDIIKSKIESLIGNLKLEEIIRKGV